MASKIGRWLLFIVLFSGACFANQAYVGYCSNGGTKVVTSGLNSTTSVMASYPGCTVTVNNLGGGLATIFSDNLGTPLSNPFQASLITGQFIFYANNARYSITLSGGTPLAFPLPVTITDVLLNDPASPLGCLSIPALTGDVTSAGGTCATVLPNIAAAGTGLKTTINAKGQVTGVASAASTDLSDTALIARLNAAANFGANPVTTGALVSTTGTFSGSISGTGATFTSEVAPSVTGVQLGDTAHRWDLFARNIDWSGTFSGGSLSVLSLAVTNNATIGGSLAVTGPSTLSSVNTIVYASGSGWKCDGITDDTIAFNTSLTTLFNSNGGELRLPSGTCLIAGQVTLPNNGAVPPVQKDIKIVGTGAGGHYVLGASSNAPLGGTILNMTFNSTTGKIDTRGAGSLEVSGISFEDTAVDCAAFVFTTNTNVRFHDNEFFGTTAGAGACNDVFILGGTSTVIDGSATSPFQGYGSTIHDNFANRVKRFAVGQTFANSIPIYANTIAINSGNPAGGAIEFIPDISGDEGNYIAGNLIEVTNYKYGIWGKTGFTSNQLIANSCWDKTATTTACIRFDSGAVQNYVISGAVNPAVTEISDGNTQLHNTYLSTGQFVSSTLLAPYVISQNSGVPALQILQPNAQPGYDIKDTTNNDEWYWVLQPAAHAFTLNFKPLGAAAQDMWDSKWYGATDYSWLCNSTANCYLESPAGNLRLRTLAGSTVFIGDPVNTGLQVTNGNVTIQTGKTLSASGQIISTLATGTAPLSIVSTTPVINLSLGGGVGTSAKSATYSTDTDCSSSASPAVCAAAAAGSVAIANPGTTIQVNTTAVTNNSQIFVQEDSSLGTKLGVTCNATLGRTFQVTARVAGTSFTITASATPAANSACLSYLIIN